MTRSTHFEVFSQAGDLSGIAAAHRLEQLRSLFEMAGLKPESDLPVRVIGFRSGEEYDRYRLRPLADAFYVGTETRNYIVLPSLEAKDFGMAAHEYTHAVLHSKGLRLPLWINEGLAEYFATVQIGAEQSRLGGRLPGRMQTLEHMRWMGLRDLLDRPAELTGSEDRSGAEIFYAESWALTEMLLESAEYRSQFPKLTRLLNQSASKDLASSQILVKVYGRSLDEMSADLRRWVEEERSQTAMLPGIKGEFSGETSTLSGSQGQVVMADLLTATGATDRARKIIETLLRDLPNDPEVLGVAGNVAFRGGDGRGARRYWRTALQAGSQDADLCFRYAVSAEAEGESREEIRFALKRAIQARSNFDDARYKLALLEFNEGNCNDAFTQLRSMRSIRPEQAYNYWVATAFAFMQAGDRSEAAKAAEHALEYAGNATERTQALQLLSISKTAGDVQVTRDSSGHACVTAKTVNNSAE